MQTRNNPFWDGPIIYLKKFFVMLGAAFVGHAEGVPSCLKPSFVGLIRLRAA
jgi:hypothetical protein